MEIINGIPMKNFTSEEFPEDPEKYADTALLIALQYYRNKINMPFKISPVKGALARFDGRETSMHRIIEEKGHIVKRSKAIDGFPKGDIFKAWAIAQGCGLWNGMGVYFDTELNDKYQPLLHLDKREKPLIWYRINKNEYHYPYEKGFYKELRELFIIDKKLRKRI